MDTAQIQVPANAQRLTVKPSEIRSGDWMRDLGRLRQVNTIEPLGDGVSRADDETNSSALYVIRFADEPDGDFAALGVWEAFPVTVWREPYADFKTSADAADGSVKVLMSGRSSQMPTLLLDGETADMDAFTFGADTATFGGPMMDGREDDGGEDSGGKHGGGGGDTNDNKDGGHIPPGDQK